VFALLLPHRLGELQELAAERALLDGVRVEACLQVLETEGEVEDALVLRARRGLRSAARPASQPENASREGASGKCAFRQENSARSPLP
jgi:hypothetical protein